MEEIEKLEQTGMNVNKFCKATQEKINAGVLVPTVIVMSDESESEEMEMEDDWYCPEPVYVVKEVLEEWWD